MSEIQAELWDAVGGERGWWLEQLADRPALEQCCADQSEDGLRGESGEAVQLNQLHQQMRDQRSNDPQGDGVTAGAEEVLNLQVRE